MNAAALLFCLVVGVSDGDTITVRCGEEPQMKVRLAEIDAPEKAQPFGSRAKQALSDLVYMKQVELRPSATDRYGRTIAHVLIADRGINFAMVEQGFAWCYEQYLQDKAGCHRLQDDAQAAHRGVWSDPTPVPPWEYRKERRKPKA